MIAAVAAAKEVPQLSLTDALELTLLVSRKDPRRHPRVATRWLQRYLEEDPVATIEEAGLATSALLALTGAGYQEAVQTLRAMAERPLGVAGSRGVAGFRAGSRCSARAFGSPPGPESRDPSECSFRYRRSRTRLTLIDLRHEMNDPVVAAGHLRRAAERPLRAHGTVRLRRA